ncbi:MAG: helix-turn-helix transcriptional regulator [Bacillota bacterium]|nr:helix-turn-helix transcriptional regulator [Bacillota bacterium]
MAQHNGSLGLKIKAIRESRGLTQAQLARMVQTDTSLICKIEKGCTASSLQTLRKIAAALDVKVSELIDEAEATGTEGM